MERRRNTKTYRFFNANPKGRITGDCVTRAITKATGKDYNDVVMDLARIHVETGYDGETKEGYSRLLEEYGWVKNPQPKKPSGKKYTGEEFCKLLNKEKKDSSPIIAHIGGNHIVAIVPTDMNDPQENWKVFDIWDSTDGCIGNYWTKKASI